MSTPPARGLCPQKPQQCLGPEQMPRPTLSKYLIPLGYYQWPKCQSPAPPGSKVSSFLTHTLTPQGTQASADYSPANLSQHSHYITRLRQRVPPNLSALPDSPTPQTAS